MKKGIIALVILLLCAFAYQAYATDYYAQADAEITTAELWDTNPAGGGTDLTWANLKDGDVLYANNHAITIANDIGSASVTATLTTAAGTGTAGGSFTFDISAATAKTLYVHRVAGTTPCLIVTGAGAGADTLELTLNGDSTAGGSSSAHGTSDNHTLGKVVNNGANTGGSNVTAYGYAWSGATGTLEINGNATGLTGYGVYIAGAGAGTASLTGDCIGSNTAVAVGCYGGNTVILTVAGNIINNDRAWGASGSVRWNPTAPSDGVNGHYIKIDGGGTPLYVGKNTETTSKALTDFYYFTAASATSTVGTATTTGGGAWGW
jgi:hypothetical protein